MMQKEYNRFSKFSALLAVVMLAVVMLAVWMLGFKNVDQARADLGEFYVDTATGVDDLACGTTSAPCKTISYTLQTHAVDGDTIHVAQGTYTENLSIGVSITIEGGFEAATWTRDPSMYETVIDGSGSQTIPGDFDEYVRYPMVIKDGGTHKMWYTGLDLDGIGRIGYATSPDGVNWTRYGDDPVLDVGAEGDWDSHVLEGAYVIKEGPTSYKMWYSDANSCAVGYATSSDGINWTKYAGNPVLTPGVDDWNNVCILHPSILYEGGMYKMWFYSAGDAGSGPSPYMAYATSPDGITWTFVESIFGLTWEQWFWRPNVRNTGSGYQMWYSLYDGEARTTYATATDETTWSKHGSAVLSGTGGEWDAGNAANPFVIYEAGSYTMWYGGQNAIGVVTSTNGIDWTKPTNSPVFTGGDPSQMGLPVIDIQDDSKIITLDGLTITGGDSFYAGGIMANEADLTVRNCLITDNKAYGENGWGAGGILGGNPLTVADSAIVNNQVNQGASGIRPSVAVISNTLIADNAGDFGIHTNHSLDLLNVTIVNNDGGVLYNPQFSGQHLNITNSIVYSTGHAITEEYINEIQVTYSNVQADWSGTGNINQDPMFADIANGDYRLKLGSPSIDTGTNSGAPDHDLDGGVRPVDGDLDGIATTDMGAYEASVERLFLPLMIR